MLATIAVVSPPALLKLDFDNDTLAFALIYRAFIEKSVGWVN
jgi:hypothetical protein